MLILISNTDTYRAILGTILSYFHILTHLFLITLHEESAVLYLLDSEGN